MTTITEFLLARIAEDERAAKVATAGPWRYDPAKVNSVDGEESVFAGPRGLAAVTVASTGPSDNPESMADAAHIARHNPPRVLAECAAKRAVVRRYESFYATRRANWTNPNYQGAMEELGFVLQRMADVYADQPDYLPEWAV